MLRVVTVIHSVTRYHSALLFGIMRKLSLVLFLLLVLAVIAAHTQTSREKEPDCNSGINKRVAITSEDAAVLGLVIGRTTLKDVQTKLGAAKVMRVSRDEESDVSICYISPQDGTVLVLYSGVMAASSNAITWFGCGQRRRHIEAGRTALLQHW